VEKAVLGGGEDTARRGEAGDVVVGRLHAITGGESRGGHDEFYALNKPLDAKLEKTEKRREKG
jgi:hypothetical protein